MSAKRNSLTRREFLKVAGTAAFAASAGSVLAACVPAPGPGCAGRSHDRTGRGHGCAGCGCAHVQGSRPGDPGLCA